MAVTFMPGTPAKLLDRFQNEAANFKTIIILGLHGADEPYLESSAISDVELCQLKCFFDAYVMGKIHSALQTREE